MRTVPKAIFPQPALVVSEEAIAVLAQVDGVRTVSEIARSLSRTDDAVWRALDELASAEAIAPLAPPAGTAPLRRRQLLTGALLAGGALGLVTAAPALAAAEQDQKHGEKRSKVEAKNAESKTKHTLKADEQRNKKSAAESKAKMTAKEQDEKKSQATHETGTAHMKAAEQAQKTSAKSSSQ